MPVYKATLEDAPKIWSMACKFADATEYKEYSDDVKIAHVIDHFLKSDNTAIFICEHGFIAGMINEFLLGNKKMATEMGWWIDPSERGKQAGKELLDAFEQWAKDQGCDLITLICLDDQVGKYYEKRGYKLCERSYLKCLQ